MYMYRLHLAMNGVQTLVVIGTDCTVVPYDHNHRRGKDKMRRYPHMYFRARVRVMVFNITFNNISAIS
jgi:hypothetical protein